MIIPDGYAQCNLMFVGGALPRNAQIAIGVDDSDDAAAAVIGASVAGCWVDTLHQLLSEGVTLLGVNVKKGPNDTGGQAFVASGEPGGEAAAEPLPPNVSLLVRKNSALGGHKGTGRMFVPGVPEAATTGGGYLVPASLTAFQSAADDFYDALGVAGYNMVILHTAVGTPNLVNGLSVQQLFATQKRRIRRAGGRRAAA